MRRGSWKFRILIGLAIVAFAFIRRCSNQTENPYTGRVQNISMTTQEEIQIGLAHAPTMAEQHGGLHPDNTVQAYVDAIGKKLVQSTIAKESPYPYDFHVLADDRTVNAFALPGGQIFITYALLSRLQNEDQVAGVLGHEIGHVLGKHSAERIAESQYWQTLSQGAQVGADAGGLVTGIGQNTLLKNGRDDELESDNLGVLFMIRAGYDPYAMIEVMKILKAAAGPNRAPEFQNTHPDPDNRIEKIEEAIKEYEAA
ncbi:M48 family metallopeptidase [Gangjinia marincola]|uniref:M48 family metallopeptidase n=1 Tax=Gangjinia marincola TaxID=578463 RepID=A0ABP3XXR6_9FLAO